ncbi:hypothetical protein A9168_14030 [Macellibacteroides sp. HH-ZS]|nr:hypothetical protein A9168_14030 [Macellibacteroides sp. HH-ZS]
MPFFLLFRSFDTLKISFFNFFTKKGMAPSHIWLPLQAFVTRQTFIHSPEKAPSKLILWKTLK